MNPLRGRDLARLVNGVLRASITTVQGRYGLLIEVKTRSCVGGSKSTDVCRSKITKEMRQHRRRFKISLVSWHWRVRSLTRDIAFPDRVSTRGFHPTPGKFHFKQREVEEGKTLSKKPPVITFRTPGRALPPTAKMKDQGDTQPNAVCNHHAITREKRVQ